MPAQSRKSRPDRTVRDVVFVDGVRTPFGKAGPKGMYAETRADDLVIRCIRELLRRNPSLPPERVDDVAIAATTQIGDQGLTIGRTAALLSGLPKTVPGYAIDRMCAGAMTAVTTSATGIAFGAYDVVIAGGVEHMGHHPMGEGVDPNPRIIAEKLVDPSALVMGATAENLHDRFPAAHQGARRRVRGRQPGQVRQGLRQRQDPARPRADGHPQRREGLGPGHAGRAAPPGHDAREPRDPQDPVPAARPGHRRQRRRPERRCHRLPARRRGRRRRARPAGEDAAGAVRVRRRGARGDGGRPGAGHREGAGQGRSDHRGHRPVRAQRGVRRAGAGVPRPLRHRRRRPPGQRVRRRHRGRPPAGVVRRPADDPAGPAVRGPPRGAVRPDRHVHRHRHGWRGHLGEPELDRLAPTRRTRSERHDRLSGRGRHARPRAATSPSRRAPAQLPSSRWTTASTTPSRRHSGRRAWPTSVRPSTRPSGATTSSPWLSPASRSSSRSAPTSR